MDSINQRKFSKMLTYILRHRPEEYGVTLDEGGFADIDGIVQAVKVKREWSQVTEADVLSLARSGDSLRFEISGKKIRATYGHTLANPPVYEPVEPPPVLYDAVVRGLAEQVRTEGLVSRDRCYVHLSSDEKTAEDVGLRHDDYPLVLKIDAARAHADGIEFYHAVGQIFLAKGIPAKYIEFPEL